MADIRSQLEEERRIIDAATAGPWEDFDDEGQRMLAPPSTGAYLVNYGADRDQQTRDAKFIAHARAALPLRNAQIEAVYALHAPTDFDGTISGIYCSVCRIGPGYMAETAEYPCETVRAIERAG